LERVIAKGAEADLLEVEWCGLRAIKKIRRPKAYRHPQLDYELRRSRTAREAHILHKAKANGVPTPLVYQVDPVECSLTMEYVEGPKVRDLLPKLEARQRAQLFKKIGFQAGVMHRSGIIHGDLTTSNMIQSRGRPVFIDFGLGEVSYEVEKRGVDLNLMNRMLTSTHYQYREDLLEAFIEGYRAALGEEAEEALNRMREIEKRGRYIEKD